MSRRSVVAAVVVAAASLAGCASNTPGELSNAAARVLKPAVQDVRTAAATGSYAEVHSAVDALKRLVQQEQTAGDVSAARATAIEDAADVLLQDARTALKPSPSPTPSPTPTSPSPTPTPSPTPSPTPTLTSAPPSTSPSPSESGSPVVSVSAGGLGAQPSP